MAMADDRQRIMPMPEDLEPPRGYQLAFKEAVRIVNATNRAVTGEVRFLVRPFRFSDAMYYVGSSAGRWIANTSTRATTRIARCMDGFRFTPPLACG